ncbi:MAG TPA: nucleotide exchange factor GrpE [Clostridia bacterium]|nr:nucleotide exchange factor GrpE [Clostridia bacterium]
MEEIKNEGHKEVETSKTNGGIVGSNLKAVINETQKDDGITDSNSRDAMYSTGEGIVDNNLDTVIDETEELEEKSISPEEELAKKTAQYEDIFDKFQRLQADFANYKKRVEKEKNEIFLYANEKIGFDLLNIIDSLEGAMQPQNRPDNSEEFDCILSGINLVYKQLIDTLARHGIEEIEALGKPFDMNFHHAVAQEETECEPNYVIEVLQKGYKINDRMLRPAMVKVSK